MENYQKIAILIYDFMTKQSQKSQLKSQNKTRQFPLGSQAWLATPAIEAFMQTSLILTFKEIPQTQILKIGALQFWSSAMQCNGFCI